MNLFSTIKTCDKQVEENNLSIKPQRIQAGEEIKNIHALSLKTIDSASKGSSIRKTPSIFDYQNRSVKNRSLKSKLKRVQSKHSHLVDHFSTSKQNLKSSLRDFIHSLALKKKNQKIDQVSAVKENEIHEFSAKILKVTQENGEFKTLRFKCPKDWQFQPGQYLEIRGENGGKPTILAVASGNHDGYIEVTARPNANPEHPNYSLNRQPGEYLHITGPLGSHFPLDLVNPNTPVLLLGGGSGLTALRSVMLSLPKKADAKMIYSTKSAESLLYRKQVEYVKSKGHTISLTQDKVKGFEEGRITEHLKDMEIKPETLIFICGPKELVLETAQMLANQGVPREQIYGSLPSTAQEGGPVYRGDHPKMIS